jgi:hypothetical protein
MAHVKSNAHLCDDAPMQEGEGATVERGASGENHVHSGSVQGSVSVRASDAGSQSNTECNFDRGSRSYNFDPLTVTLSLIREMTKQGCFAEGGARASGEENILKPEDDEVIVFEEFFTASFRMPPHPVLTDILLKF